MYWVMVWGSRLARLGTTVLVRVTRLAVVLQVRKETARLAMR